VQHELARHLTQHQPHNSRQFGIIINQEYMMQRHTVTSFYGPAYDLRPDLPATNSGLPAGSNRPAKFD
jgi:hypothetical protein